MLKRRYVLYSQFAKILIQIIHLIFLYLKKKLTNEDSSSMARIHAIVNIKIRKYLLKTLLKTKATEESMYHTQCLPLA